MKNKITNVDDYLFLTLEVLSNDELKREELNSEINRAKAITDVVKTKIAKDNLLLNAIKHADEYGKDVSEVLQLGDK